MAIFSRIPRSLKLLCLLILILAPSSVDAQDDDRFDLVGRIYNYWDDTFDVAIQGDYAYLATGASGLQIVDISDPEEPSIVGFFDTFPGYSGQMTISGDNAYAANDGGGLFVLDVSDPTEPELLGRWESDGSFVRLVVDEIEAYLLDTDGNITVLDVFDPEEPEEITNYELPGAGIDLALVSDYLLTIVKHRNQIQDGELVILDITDPADVIRVSSMHQPRPEAIAVSDRTAFVLNSVLGLNVVDISRPDSPWIRRVIGTRGSSVTWNDHFVFIASPTRLGVVTRINIVDVIEEDNPIIGSVTVGGSVSEIVPAGDYLYSVGDGRLRIVDVSTVRRPENIMSFTNNDAIKAIEIAGEFVYAVNQSHGFSIVDISDLTDPVEVASYLPEEEIVDVVASDGLAYVLTADSLIMYDVEDPQEIELTGTYTVRRPRSIEVFDQLGFISETNIGLKIIDLSEPADPRLITTIGEQSGWMYMTSTQDRVYLSDEAEGFFILEVSRPDNPRLYRTPYGSNYHPSDLTVADEFAFLLVNANPDGDNPRMGMIVLDVSDPDDVTETAFLPLQLFAWTDIKLVGERVFILSSERGEVRENNLYVVDIADPADPRMFATYHTPGYAREIETAGEYAFVADHTNLGVYDISGVLETPGGTVILPSSPDMLEVYPNPTNGRVTVGCNVTHPGSLWLAVYTLDGRLVEELYERRVSIGSINVNWDISTIPAGIYILNLTDRFNLSVSERIVVLK